jgi:hypothetical protein
VITDADLADARALQASIMLDAGVLEEKTGTEFDPDTNTTVDVWTEVWSGPGRAQARLNQGASQPVVAGQQVELQGYACAIPWDAPPVHTGMRWRVTASADPLLVGKALAITTVHTSTFATARHFNAVDNQG